MPRIRPGRNRSKNTNRRAPLLLSTMAPEDYNVRPAEVKSIACPDCRTWRRIMGEKILKIREHGISDKVAEGGKRTLCPGTDQVVVIDIDVRRWQVKQDRLLREAMPQDNRRAAQQFFKPLPPPPAPVSRIVGEITLDSARQSYLAHRKGCRDCMKGQHCTDGERLARRFAQVVMKTPNHREANELLARQDARTARKRAQQRAARGEQWAKHGGEAVETANNQCRKRESDALSEFRGPDLPMLPQDVPAHDRRQAELGRQYGRKAPATSAA
ncbi:hypothetical protein [Streptomyces candidus]|uniref:Uncharacterized protein n=1 Tax=Streptomyces candidus TaxID=67283 RepID=A0A7X0HMG1_9ACTN|nr:hypothetical protein [Streptomyces candidus]MBB6439072.1 hypothetical protein [Streptomyces candidus]GHH55531.1 hypothetical protein GCM10018773_60140 [Streptomyces candidus]